MCPWFFEGMHQPARTLVRHKSKAKYHLSICLNDSHGSSGPFLSLRSIIEILISLKL